MKFLLQIQHQLQRLAHARNFAGLGGVSVGKEVVNKLTVREEGANEIVKISDESKQIFKTLNDD